MVIQRWQSVFLLLASIMMGCSCFLPMAIAGETTITPASHIAYLALNAVITILLLISIFLYKNLHRQKTVVKIGFLMTIASAITAGIIIYNSPSATIDWTGNPLLTVCSMVLILAAYRRIIADEKLLKSYDRIR